MRELGINQELALEALERHGGWSGWTLTNTSTTIRILESLVKRGLVVRKESESLRAKGFHPFTYELAPKPARVEPPKGPSATVEICKPLPGTDEPTLRFEADTTSDSRINYKIALTTARRLMRELSLAIKEVEETCGP